MNKIILILAFCASIVSFSGCRTGNALIADNNTSNTGLDSNNAQQRQLEASIQKKSSQKNSYINAFKLKYSAVDMNIEKAFQLYKSAPIKSKFETQEEFNEKLKRTLSSKVYKMEINLQNAHYQVDKKRFYWGSLLPLVNVSKDLYARSYTGQNAFGAEAEVESTSAEGLHVTVASDEELSYSIAEEDLQLLVEPSAAEKMGKAIVVFRVENIEREVMVLEATISRPREYIEEYITLYAQDNILLFIDDKPYKLEKSAYRFLPSTFVPAI